MEKKPKLFTFRKIIGYLFLVIVIPFLPLIISGHWGWWEGWASAGITILGFAVSRGLASSRHPDIIAERSSFLAHKDAKSWDSVILVLYTLGNALVMLTAGLEGLFDGLLKFGTPWKALSLVIMLGGYGLGTWAMIENRFFSDTVRIQTDRGHQVVNTGPYQIVRHPGYAGTLLYYLGLPILFGSRWTYLPVLFLVILFVVRTSLEDRTLQNELPGYREYAQKVRYRLLPGIW